MGKYLDELLAARPELRNLRPYIGEQLAAHYTKNLGGRYKRRAEESLRIALETPTEQLRPVISGLLADRLSKGVPEEEIRVPPEEGSQRALIIALCANRRAYQGAKGVWQTDKKAMYGDENYMPRISPAAAAEPPEPAATLHSGALYTPSCEDVNTAYRRRCRPGDEVDPETLLGWVEEDLKAAGKRLAPGWRDIVREHCL